MAYSFVQVPPNSTGVKIAGYTDASSEFNQTAVIVDSNGNLVNIDTASTTGTERALFVRASGGFVTNYPASAATATLTNVSGSASSVTLQAANSSRLGWTLFNDSSAVLKVKYGSTASATSFTYLVSPSQQLEMPINPVYTGIITGIWTSATGSARMTELTT